MFKINERLKKVEPSATLEITSLSNALKEKGYDVISFGLGEPDFKTPKKIIDWAYEAMNDGHTHYTPPPGYKEVRRAIAEKYRGENGVEAEWKNVLITPAKFAIFIGMASLLNEGDEVLVPNPGWVSYPQMAKLAGAKVVEYSISTEKRVLDEEEIKEKISNKTKMILINSPSNPTGSVFSKEDMGFLRDMGQEKDLVILSDEVYEKIIYGGRHISPASLDGMFERTITVNGFSKCYAMTGWRMGYLIAPEDVLKQVVKIQSHTVTCAPAFAQIAVGKALGDEEVKGEVKKMVNEFSERREIIYKELVKIPIFEVYKPNGAFYMFPKYNCGMGSNDFARTILRKKHVVVTPGSAFGSFGENHLRFSFATSKEEITRGVERLRELAEEIA